MVDGRDEWQAGMLVPLSFLPAGLFLCSLPHYTLAVVGVEMHDVCFISHALIVCLCYASFLFYLSCHGSYSSVIDR